MVERMFERAIEQLGGKHQAAIEQQQGPPNGGRSEPEQGNEYTYRGNRLLAHTHFGAPCTDDAMPRKPEAPVEGLVFHGGKQGNSGRPVGRPQHTIITVQPATVTTGGN